jgi:tetrahydromethanopterin S-methyltransferase subunit H
MNRKMLTFKKEQKIIEIGGIKIGGQPGELPTVLIGSLFHKGHNIVKDRKMGIFDKQKARRLIETQQELSDKTGVSCMLDIVAESPEVLMKYVDFVSEVTNAPFLINGQEMSVRVAAASHAVELGLQDKAVYNSINYTLSENEIKAVKETEIKAAVIQAFNPRNPRPEGMISVLEGTKEKDGLLERAFKAGIEKPLVLMPVLDVPSVGFAAQGIHMAKEKFGIPTGTAPVGVVGKWKRIEEYENDAKKVCRGGAAVIAQMMGADFIIYGSITKAKTVFPVCAMTDAIIAYNARTLGIKSLVKDHPLLKIF